MAYVMNPNSYRLGFSLSWYDSWYSNKKLYPILLQNIISVRNFLIYYLTHKRLEQLDIYLSNLNLMIKSSRLFIVFFFYETSFDLKKEKKNLNKIISRANLSINIPFNFGIKLKNLIKTYRNILKFEDAFTFTMNKDKLHLKNNWLRKIWKNWNLSLKVKLANLNSSDFLFSHFNWFFLRELKDMHNNMLTLKNFEQKQLKIDFKNDQQSNLNSKKNTRLFYKQFLQGWKEQKTSFIDKFWKEEQILNDIYLSKYLNHTFEGKDRPMIQKFTISYNSIALKNILRSIHIESIKNMPFDKIEIKFLNKALKFLYNYKNFFYKYNKSFLFFSNIKFLNYYNLWLKKYLKFHNYKGMNDFMLRGQAAFNNFLWLKRSRFKSYKKFISAKNRLIVGHKFGQGLYLDSWYTSTILAQTWKAVYNKKNQFVKLVRLNYEGQRFFTFFALLGLDPQSLLLEFYLRQHGKNYTSMLSTSWLYDLRLDQYYQANVNITKITRFELTVLRKIYAIMNKNITFNWMYDKKDNSLNLLRFLRNLFFYATMPFFGSRFEQFAFLEKKRFKSTKGKLKNFLLLKKKNFLYKRLRKKIIYKLISLYKFNKTFYNKLFDERKKQNTILSKLYIMFINYKAYAYRSTLNFFKVRRFNNSFDYSIDDNFNIKEILSKKAGRLESIIQRSMNLKKNYFFKTFISRIPFYDTHGDNIYLNFMQEFRSFYILFKRFDYLGFAIDKTINLKELSFFFFFFILEDYFKLLIKLNKKEEKKLIELKFNFLKKRLYLIKKKLRKLNFKKEKIKGAPKERSLIALRRSGKKKKNSGINWSLIEQNISIASGEEMRALVLKNLNYSDYFKRPHILKQKAAVPIFWNFSYKQKLRFYNLIHLNKSKLLTQLLYEKKNYASLKKRINKSKFIPIIKNFIFQYIFSVKIKKKKKDFINLIRVLKTYIYVSDLRFFSIFWEGRLFQLRMFQHMFKNKHIFTNLEKAFNLARKKNKMHKYYVPLLDWNILKANVEQVGWGSLNRIFVNRLDIFDNFFNLKEFLLIKKLNNKIFYNENYYIYNNNSFNKNLFAYKFLLNKKKDYIKFLKKKFKNFFYLTFKERSKIKKLRIYFDFLNRKIIQNSIKKLVNVMDYLYFEKITLLRVFYFFHKDFFLFFYNFNFVQELLKFNFVLKLNIFKKNFKIFNLFLFFKQYKKIKKKSLKNKYFSKDFVYKLDLFFVLLKILYKTSFIKLKKDKNLQWNQNNNSNNKKTKLMKQKIFKKFNLLKIKKIFNNKFLNFINNVNLNLYYLKEKIKLKNKKIKKFKKLYKYQLRFHFSIIKNHFFKNNFINYFFKFDSNIRVFLFNYNKALYFLDLQKSKFNKLNFLKKFLLKTLNKLNFSKKRNYLYIFYKLVNLNFNILDFFIKKSNILKKFKLLKHFIKFFFFLLLFLVKFKKKKKSYNLLKFVILNLFSFEKTAWNLITYWKNYDYNFLTFYNKKKFKNLYYNSLQKKGMKLKHMRKLYKNLLKYKLKKKLKKIYKYLKKKKSRKFFSIKIYYKLLSHNKNNFDKKKKIYIYILKYLCYIMFYYINLYNFMYNYYFFNLYNFLSSSFKQNLYKFMLSKSYKLKKKFFLYKINQLYFFNGFVKNYNKSFIFLKNKKKKLAVKEWKWELIIQLFMFLINNQLYFYWKNILNILKKYYKYIIYKFKNFYYLNTSYLVILKNILLTISFKQIISDKDISYYFISFMDNFLSNFFFKNLIDWKFFINLNFYLKNFNSFINLYSNVRLNFDKKFILSLIEDKLQSNIKNIFLKKMEYLNATLTIFKLNLWTPNIYKKKWEKFTMNEKFINNLLNKFNYKQKVYFKNILFNLFNFSKNLDKESFILSKFEQRLFKFFKIKNDDFFGNTFLHGKEQKKFLKFFINYKNFLYKFPKYRFLNLRKKRYKNYTLLNLNSLKKMYKLVIIHNLLINKWNFFELYFNYANYLYKLNYNLHFFTKFYNYYKNFNQMKYDYIKYKKFFFLINSLYKVNKIKFISILKKFKEIFIYYKKQYIIAYKTYKLLFNFIKKHFMQFSFKNLDKSLLLSKEKNYIKLQSRLKYLKASNVYYKKFLLKKSFLIKMHKNFLNYIKNLKKYTKRNKQIIIKNLLLFYLKMPLYITYKKKIKKNIKFSKKFLLQKFWLGFFLKNSKEFLKNNEFKIFLESMEIDGIYFWFNFLIFLRKYIYKKINWIFVFRKLRAQNFDSILTTYITKQLFYLRKFRKLYKKKIKLFLYKNNYVKRNLNFGFNIFHYFIVDNWSKWKKKDLLNISIDFLHLQKIRFSYARLFFAFWYIRLSMPYNVKPIDMYANFQYSDRHLFYLHMTLLYMLVKKPFLVMLSKYFSYIITKHWLGWNLVFNYVMVTNEDLSAQFIARHIANAFKMDFGWKDIIVPIKKDLSDLVTNYRFLAQRDNNNSIINNTIKKNFNKLNYDYRLNNFNKNLFNINTTDIKYLFSNLIDIIFLQFSNYLKSIYFFWLNLIEISFFYLQFFFFNNIYNYMFLYSFKIFIIKYIYMKFVLYFILNIYYKYLKYSIKNFEFIQNFKNFIFFINRLFIFNVFFLKYIKNKQVLLKCQYKYIYFFYWYLKNKINIYFTKIFIKKIFNYLFVFKKINKLFIFLKTVNFIKFLPFVKNLKKKNFNLHYIQNYLKDGLLINNNLLFFFNIFFIYKKKNTLNKLKIGNLKKKFIDKKILNKITIAIYKIFFFIQFSKIFKFITIYKFFNKKFFLNLRSKFKFFIKKFINIFNKNIY